MPVQAATQFVKPAQGLYSKHYRPIVTRKLAFNEDYQLRASKYGKIDLDWKRERILDEYSLQANPFRTPLSNSLLMTMRTAR